MPTPRDVAVLCGSLRKGSFSRRAAVALAEAAPPTLRLGLVEIRDLPLFDADLEADMPPPAQAFKARIAAADAVLFVTPEYNRSVPGGLKNAIDWASRPYGESAWTGKPAGIVTVSTGAVGGFGANHHLRQMLVFLDAPSLQQPEMYVGNAAKLFGDGVALPQPTRELFAKFLAAFDSWVTRLAPAR